MNQPLETSTADLVAEANHFRTEALRQELETGERKPLVEDALADLLPSGMQKTRPAFAKDDPPASG